MHSIDESCVKSIDSCKAEGALAPLKRMLCCTGLTGRDAFGQNGAAVVCFSGVI